MTAFVLDCSIAMSWCFEDEARPETDAILSDLRVRGASVPTLWYWEVGNALNAAARKGRITARAIQERLNVFSGLPIAADAESSARAWRETMLTAQSHGLTVYEAAYLELAVRKGADLATNDAALRRAAAGLGVVTLP